MKKTTMTVAQMRARMVEIDTRLSELKDTLAKENRSLNEDENKEFANLRAERSQLQLNSYIAENPVPAMPQKRAVVSRDKVFGEIIRSMADGKGIPEKYDYLRSANGGLMIPQYRDDEPGAGEGTGAGETGSGTEEPTVTIQNNESVANITPVHMGEIVEALHPGEVIGALGLNIQTLVGQWNFPTVAGAEAEWADENVEISDSKIEIGKISPSPKRLAISVPISKRAIYQSGGKIREIVLKAINDAITTAFNVSMLATTQESGSKAPLGAVTNLKNARKITLNAAPTRANVLALMKKVYETGVKSKNPAFVAGSDMFFTLAATPKDEGSGRFMIEDIKTEDDIVTGVMEGVKVVMSDYVGSNNLAFGVWGYELLGMFGAADLTIDSTSKDVAKKHLVYFVLNVEADMCRLRDEAFALMIGQ